MKVSALIPAAGIGKRFSEDKNKLFFTVKGKTVLEHTVTAFDCIFSVSEIIIVTNEEAKPLIEQIFASNPKVRTVLGGKERQDSVRIGLEYVSNDYVLIHDGARPLVSEQIIKNCIEELKNNDAVCVCVPATDTVKECKNGFILNTPDRKKLYKAQTPQGFKTDLIYSLHKKIKENNIKVTDDASVCEWAGIPVKIAEGDYRNIKVTAQNDIYLLKTYFGENMNRIGQGYDVHRLTEGRKLILGGVDIPHEKGLLGHSDADVLLHAITDAVFGALALGDLGKHFPPSDNKYKNIDSMILLKEAVKKAEEKGWAIGNIDATVSAQKPKLSPYIDQMRENISKALNIDKECISIKATTTEKLGFEGREEGISAQAIVLMTQI